MDPALMELNPDDSHQHPIKGICTMGEGEGSSLRYTTGQTCLVCFTYTLVTIQDKGQANRPLPSRKDCGFQDFLVNHS